MLWTELINRKRYETGPCDEEADELSPEMRRDSDLNNLTDHCLAAHALIDEHGTPVMRRLIDPLLFQIGAAIGSGAGGEPDLN